MLSPSLQFGCFSTFQMWHNLDVTRMSPSDENEPFKQYNLPTFDVYVLCSFQWYMMDMGWGVGSSSGNTSNTLCGKCRQMKLGRMNWMMRGSRSTCTCAIYAHGAFWSTLWTHPSMSSHQNKFQIPTTYVPRALTLNRICNFADSHHSIGYAKEYNST